MARTLPRWMHQKHGAYYLVRDNKWRRLSDNLRDALVEYAFLTAGPEKAALNHLIARAMADMKPTVAANTHKNHMTCAQRVLEAFAEFTPQQIKPHHIACFLDDNKATPGMANLLRSFLNAVFQRAVCWGVVEANPVRDIKPFKTSKRDRYITDEEYAAIRAKATPTLRAIMDICYLTGQRIGDVLKIRHADIDEEGIFFQQQKTGHRLKVALTADLNEAVETARLLHTSVRGMTLFHTRQGKPLSYWTVRTLWARAATAAGVSNAHLHDIRAKAATDAKAQGLDSKTLLGHTTESSHNRYLRSKEIQVVEPVKIRKS